METQHTYTAHIEHHGEWWIGWILEVSGVTCQERTREELLETLKITLLEILAYDDSGNMQTFRDSPGLIELCSLSLTTAGSAPCGANLEA